MSGPRTARARLRAAMPLLLTVLGLVGIGSLAAYRLWALEATAVRALGAIAFGGYVLWLAWESRVSVAELGKDEADQDRGTMEMAAAAKIAVLLCAFGFGPSLSPGAWLGALGLAVLAAGVWMRASAIRALGAGYSHRIRLPAPPLVEVGPYGLVRHPAYLGTLLAHTGLVLVWLNPWSVAALLLLWYPAVFYRAALEDRFLQALPEYRAYAARVRRRMVPGVW